MYSRDAFFYVFNPSVFSKLHEGTHCPCIAPSNTNIAPYRVIRESRAGCGWLTGPGQVRRRSSPSSHCYVAVSAERPERPRQVSQREHQRGWKRFSTGTIKGLFWVFDIQPHLQVCLCFVETVILLVILSVSLLLVVESADADFVWPLWASY